MSNYNLEKTFISIVIYISSCERYIYNFFQKLSSVIENNFESYEYIIVEDAINNSEHEKIQQIIQELKGSITIIRLSSKHGKDTAITAGVDLAIGDFVYEFENIIVDYPIDNIMKVYKKALSGYDIVSLAPQRKLSLASRLFYNILEKYANRPVKLTTEIFRIASRRCINRINSMGGRIRYRKILYHTCGMQNIVLMYNPISRLKGERKSIISNIHKGLEILSAYSKLPITLCNTISLLFLSITMLLGAYAIILYFVLEQIMEGWTTTMLFLSLGFSGVFCILSLIARFLIILYDEVAATKPYIYMDVKKISRK